MDLKNKKVLSTLLVYAIAALVLLILFLVIPINKWASGWISLVFTILSLAVSFCVTIYAFGRGDKLVSKVYGFPIARVGFLYALIQTIVFLIICIVGAFVRVPAWVSIVTSVLLLAAAAIGVIITDNIRDHVEEIDRQTTAQTENISYFRLDISGLADQATDPEVNKALEKLEDEIRYSDPVSSEATREIEEEIRNQINDMKENLEDEKEVTLRKISGIISVINERNRICKVKK